MKSGEQRIEIKYGGFSAVPNEYECPDGEFLGIRNMVPEDGGLKTIYPASGLFVLPTGMRVIKVHKVTNPRQMNYIILDESGANDKLYALYDTTLSGQTLPLTIVTATHLHLINTFTDDVTNVDIVGNSLVVLTDGGLHYVLWRNGYTYLGQKVPELQISWGLNTRLECYPKYQGDNGTVMAEPSAVRGTVNNKTVHLPFVAQTAAWVKPKPVWEQMGNIPSTWESAWSYSVEHISGNEGDAGVHNWADIITNLAMGACNKFVDEYSNRKGGFVHPFFVRWAYEMFDGSLVMHSDPVLMVPNSKSIFFGLDADFETGFELEDQTNDNRGYTFRGRAYGFVGELTAKIVSNASVLSTLRSDWKDLIRSVNIYVSAPIYLYKQSERVWGWTNMDDSGAWDDYYTEGNYFPAEGSISGEGFGRYLLADTFPDWNEASGEDYDDRFFKVWHTGGYLGGDLPSYILTMPVPTAEEMEKAVSGLQTYYKVASFDLDSSDIDTYSSTDKRLKIDEGVIGSLLARESMKDDYHSRDIVKADYSFVFNGRINLSGISRKLHNPLAANIAWPRDDTHSGRSWTIAVEMKDGSTTSTVVSVSGVNGTTFPRYVSYPNIKASSITIGYTESNTNYYYKLKLKEHPYLELAYWYGGLGASPGTNTDVTDVSSSTFPTAANVWTDEVAKVFTSEVNNPFVFPLTGINTVGTTRVMGICAANKALSQGQFGQHPLYAFTQEGVWALMTTSNGGYAAVQPFTRDVCLNAESITQMDDAVLFATARGIMMISGSNCICISEMLMSEDPFTATTLPGLTAILTGMSIPTTALSMQPFRKFLDGCKMIYDYFHQRIIVYNTTYDYAYVYSLKDKKWGMMESAIDDGLNSYPDALAMTSDGTLVNLSKENATNGMKGVLITRSIKLGMHDALKTVNTIIQRGYFDAHNALQVKKVQQVLWGSRDLYNWHKVWSSQDHYLRGFRGTPYKYFRLALILDLGEKESLTGCTVQFETRYTNRLR